MGEGGGLRTFFEESLAWLYSSLKAHFGDLFGLFSVVYLGGSQTRVARIEFWLQTTGPP